MSEQESNTQSFTIKRLATNTDYFNNVFKKTESIVSVIFYILSFQDEKKTPSVHGERLSTAALKTHEVALATLTLPEVDVHTGVRTLQAALLTLESTARIAVAGRAIAGSVADVVLTEIDAVQRYIRHHIASDSGVALAPSFVGGTPPAKPASRLRSASQATAPVRRPTRVSIPTGDISTDAYLVYSQLTDRAERIKTVLAAKPEATIKDITDVITDIGEKTIQRELNSLIEKGQVKRTGERRWSRYSVSQ